MNRKEFLKMSICAVGTMAMPLPMAHAADLRKKLYTGIDFPYTLDKLDATENRWAFAMAADLDHICCFTTQRSPLEDSSGYEELLYVSFCLHFGYFKIGRGIIYCPPIPPRDTRTVMVTVGVTDIPARHVVYKQCGLINLGNCYREKYCYINPEVEKFFSRFGDELKNLNVGDKAE